MLKQRKSTAVDVLATTSKIYGRWPYWRTHSAPWDGMLTAHAITPQGVISTAANPDIP